MMMCMFPFRMIFLSTLSLRRATWQRGSRITYIEISIHALLAESDATPLHMCHRVDISIHALLAESDKGPLMLREKELK